MYSGTGSNSFSINYTRVVSLSHAFHPGIPQWPDDPAVEFQTVAQISHDGYYLRRFSLGEHSGTHLNAPASFHENGLSIDNYPLESLVASAVVVDVGNKVAEHPDYLLSVEDVQAWEHQFGAIAPGSVVLLHTGWHSRWDSPELFFNRDQADRFHFPGFGLEAARFLLDQRQIGGLGIDTHGVDGGQDDTFAVNRLVLQQPRVVLENLANLDQLPPVGATLVIGILPLIGGSGSPASVLAFVP